MDAKLDEIIWQQLAKLAESFDELGLTPVVCGGVAIYLHLAHNSIAQRERLIRITTDVDLILTPSQVLEQSRLNAIAEIITLNYFVDENAAHFQFWNNLGQRLDILAPPILDFPTKNERVYLVKGKLHGHLVEEASFVEEDMKLITLSDFFSGKGNLKIAIPSLSNMLILKLSAFIERYVGKRKKIKLAQKHAWDIYAIATCLELADYHQGQKLLSRHADSEIIQKSQQIVRDYFSDPAQGGWREVMDTDYFKSFTTRQEKEDKLSPARNRLVRLFNCSIES